MTIEITTDGFCDECDSLQDELIRMFGGTRESKKVCLSCLSAAVQMLEQAQQPTIKDRILAAIDTPGVAYRSLWSICDELGIERTLLESPNQDGTAYEQALAELVADGVLEEVPDLSYRYRRVQR